MSKLLSSIAFSVFLLFLTAGLAEEKTSPIEINATEQEVQENEVSEETEAAEKEAQPGEGQEESETTEPEEALSEAEKEAQAAEEAELREAGMYEEPVEE
jgi:hypothetical protein